jgi:hypothetical protein
VSVSITTEVIAKQWQPQEFFDLLGVKNIDEGQKVLNAAFNLIAYLKPGDSVQTSTVTITRVQDDLYHVDVRMDKKIVYDEVVKNKVIKLPV